MKKLLLVCLWLVTNSALGDTALNDANTAYRNEDYVTAAQGYKIAAAQGNAGAQYNLGTMYSNGEGVAQDHAEAVKWFRLAAA